MEWKIMKDNVIIPRKELNKLEEVRVMLWDFASKYDFNSVQMYELEQITSTMYKIANKQWEKTDE